MQSKLIATLAFTTVLGVAVAQQSPSLQTRPSDAVPNNIPSGTGLHITLDEDISSATAKIKDPFKAHLTDPVVVDGKTIAPAGATVTGRVMDVTQSGRRFNGKNTLTLRPESILLQDGRLIDLSATMIDTYDRKALKVDKEGSVSNSAHHYTKMSAIGAGVGTVAGAVVGGPAGAVAGASIGAALPAARWATKDDPVVLGNGTSYWFELTRAGHFTNEQAAAKPQPEPQSKPESNN
jgi:hypothetical protein